MNTTSTTTNKLSLQVFFKAVFFLVLLLTASEAWAQSYFRTRSNTTGSWHANNTWQIASTPAGSYSNTNSKPGPDDHVEINRNVHIPSTAGAICKTLTITGGNTAISLTFAEEAILTVMEDVQVYSPDAGLTNTIDVFRGNMDIRGSLLLGNNSKPGSIVVTAAGNDNFKGVVMVKGDVNVTNSSVCKLELTNQGQFELGGGFIGTDPTFSLSGNTRLKFNGTSSQTLPNLPLGVVYGNIYIANPAGVMLTENLNSANFRGNLYIESGYLDDNRYAIVGTTAKTLTVADGAKLNLRFSNTATKEGFPINFGTVVLEPNSTVTYNGNTGQKISAHEYGNLEILGGASKTRSLAGAVIANDVIVESDLILGNYKLDIGDNTLTLKSDGSIQGGNASSYIVMEPNGRMVVQAIGQSVGARDSEVTFPIGTSAGYSPAYLTNNSSNTYNFAIGVENGVVDYATGNPILLDGVNKTWQIECLNQNQAFNPSVDLRLQWNGTTDEMGNFDRTKCYVTHYTNGSWTTSDLFQNANNFGVSASMQGITSFSPFSVADAPTPLPVELTFFKAAKKDNAVLLNWETASEKNCLGYDILASADGKNFEFVGNVASKNGNASFTQQYEFLDKTNRTGLVYYRLKQTDLDGTVSYYATQVVDMGRFAETLVAFPNPFQDRFELKLHSAAAQEVILQINDLTGKTVYQMTPKVVAGETIIPVELSQNLPAGVYILTAKTSDQLFTSRLIKQ